MTTLDAKQARQQTKNTANFPMEEMLSVVASRLIEDLSSVCCSLQPPEVTLCKPSSVIAPTFPSLLLSPFHLLSSTPWPCVPRDNLL